MKKLLLIGKNDYTVAKFKSACDQLNISFIDYSILEELKKDIINGLQVDFLLVRGTRGKETLIKEIVSLLQGCIIVDEDKLLGDNPSKLETSLKRAENDTGPKTYTKDNISKLTISELPLFVKPINGCKNKGIKICSDVIEINRLLNTGNYIFQEVLEIKNEYRVLYIKVKNNPVKIIGIVHKKTIGKNKNSNYKNPVSFHDRLKVTNFVTKHLKNGFIGVDIADTPEGYKIIEENYAPVFNMIDREDSKDTAFTVLNYLNRIKNEKRKN